MDEFMVELLGYAQVGDYKHLIWLSKQPMEHFAHLRVSNACTIHERICNALAVEAAPRVGEPASVSAARCQRLEAEGVLQLARDVVARNCCSCSEAVKSGCNLLTAILRNASQDMLTRALLVRHSYVTLSIVTTDFTGGNPSQYGNQACAYGACCDALLALAGLHHDASPHALKPPARAVTFEHLQEFIDQVLGFEKSVIQALLDHTVWAAGLLEGNFCQAGSSTRRALLRLLRSTGRVLRLLICLTLSSSGYIDAKRLISEVIKVVYDAEAAANPQLMRWVVVYSFLPLACAARQQNETMIAEYTRLTLCFLPFNVSFCLGRCCIGRGGLAGCWREMLDLLLDDLTDASVPPALELVAFAAAAHGCCVRPAARLFAWLARGDKQQQLRLAGMPYMNAFSAHAHNSRTRSRKGAVPTSADDDDDPDGGSDGERLSEWGSDNEDGEPPCITARTESTPALVARAMRAISGESREDVNLRCAAADAAAAALLAELEGESSKTPAPNSGRKKKKKKKNPAASKSIAAAKEAPLDEDKDSDDDGNDAAATDYDDDEAAARELCARQAGAAGQAKVQLSSVRAVPRVAPVPAAAPKAAQNIIAPRPRHVPVPVAPPSSAPAVPRPAPVPAALQLRPAPSASPFQRKGRLGAAPCGCGNAACAAPTSHAPAAQGDKEEETRIEDLFPWLALQPAQEPAQPADAPHEDDDLCVICLDEPRNTPLAGCAALHPPALCRGCAVQLLAGATPVCPLCRAPAATM